MKKIQKLRTAIFMERSDEALGMMSHPEIQQDINDLVMGDTCLHVACSEGLVDVARALLARGADLEKLNNKGETPLHVAAGKGKLQCVELLVRHNADHTRVNKRGKTPYEVAVWHHRADVAEYLKNHTVNTQGNHVSDVNGYPQHPPTAPYGGSCAPTPQQYPGPHQCYPPHEQGYPPLPPSGSYAPPPSQSNTAPNYGYPPIPKPAGPAQHCYEVPNGYPIPPQNYPPAPTMKGPKGKKDKNAPMQGYPPPTSVYPAPPSSQGFPAPKPKRQVDTDCDHHSSVEEHMKLTQATMQKHMQSMTRGMQNLFGFDD